MHFSLTVFRNGSNRDHRMPHRFRQCCSIFDAVVNKGTLATHMLCRTDQIALCMELNDLGVTLEFFKSTQRIANFFGTVHIALFRRVALKVQRTRRSEHTRNILYIVQLPAFLAALCDDIHTKPGRKFPDLLTLIFVTDNKWLVQQPDGMHTVARPHDDGRIQLQTVHKIDSFFFRLWQCSLFVCRTKHIHIRHHADDRVNLFDVASDARWQPFLTQCNAIIGVGTGTQHFNALRCFVQFRDRDVLISGIRQRRDSNASFCAFTIQHLQKILRCDIHRLSLLLYFLCVFANRHLTPARSCPILWRRFLLCISPRMACSVVKFPSRGQRISFVRSRSLSGTTPF